MHFDSTHRWKSAAENVASKVLGKRASEWLLQPNADLGGKAPESLLTDRTGAQMVIAVLRDISLRSDLT